MSTENLIRITSFINRKKGVSKEDFYNYWTQVHGPLVHDFMKRHGVVEYVQVNIKPYFVFRLHKQQQREANSFLSFTQQTKQKLSVQPWQQPQEEKCNRTTA